MQFVSVDKAYQHLSLDGQPRTLCGYDEADIFDPVIYDHNMGFDPEGGPACAKCADKADAIQNGTVR